MRGLTISAHGGLDQIEYRDDLEMPALRRESDVRIRMRAAALNHLDLFLVSGLPGVSITAPWVLGADGDTLAIYYGAADTSVCLATASLSALLDWLSHHSV